MAWACPPFPCISLPGCAVLSLSFRVPPSPSPRGTHQALARRFVFDSLLSQLFALLSLIDEQSEKNLIPPSIPPSPSPIPSAEKTVYLMGRKRPFARPKVSLGHDEVSRRVCGLYHRRKWRENKHGFPGRQKFEGPSLMGGGPGGWSGWRVAHSDGSLSSTCGRAAIIGFVFVEVTLRVLWPHKHSSIPQNILI